jgi:hypothetical protein
LESKKTRHGHFARLFHEVSSWKGGSHLPDEPGALHQGGYTAGIRRALLADKPTLVAAQTLTLQKSRVLQIQGVKGAAVVAYRKPLTTQEMRCRRLSLWVNNMVVF